MMMMIVKSPDDGQGPSLTFDAATREKFSDRLHCWGFMDGAIDAFQSTRGLPTEEHHKGIIELVDLLRGSTDLYTTGRLLALELAHDHLESGGKANDLFQWFSRLIEWHIVRRSVGNPPLPSNGGAQ